MPNIETKKTICPLDCPDSCGMIATVEDGKITNLQGDKTHPYTNGYICRKMRRYPERFYGKERVLYPQIRVGKKGNAEFKRISWDEALSHICSKLTEIKISFGGEAILPYSYAGNMGAVNRFAGYPFFHRLGTSRLDQTICSATAGSGWAYHCGNLNGTPPENSRDAELIVAWGINIKVTNIHFWQYVSAARKKGGRLLVIDPYRNQTVKSADSFYQVRPGGDGALALGVIKHLVENDLHIKNNIAGDLEGFAELESYLDLLTWPEIVEDSGIGRADIIRLSEEISKSPRTFLRIGVGMSRHSRGAMAVRAITCLAALLGLFEGGTGRGVLLTSSAFKGDAAKLTFPELASSQTRTINMIQLGHALTALTPAVKGLIVYNSNPLSVNPDGMQVRKGLEREDLFTVVHEQVMTPTARYADILLPATTFLENEDVYTGYGHFYLGVAKSVVEPFAEARSNFDFFQGLAQEMGFDDAPFKQSCRERIVNYLSTVQGIPQEFEREKLFKGEYCQSSKSCFARTTTHWQKEFTYSKSVDVISPAIPCVTAPGEFGDPDLQARFPLRLITPPHPDLLNSTFGERYVDRTGELLVHPADAALSGINDGQQVIVKNFRGSCQRVARVTVDTQQGVVVAEGIFWAVEQEAGEGYLGGINDLTSQKLTDSGGGATFHESLVKLEKPVTAISDQ